MQTPSQRTLRSSGSTTRRRSPTLTLLTAFGWFAALTTTLRARAAAAREDEAGNVITDNLGWIVFGVVAIVAIGALIKTLGQGVVNSVSHQLGL
jgi:hypothetical protein